VARDQSSHRRTTLRETATSRDWGWIPGQDLRRRGLIGENGFGRCDRHSQHSGAYCTQSRISYTPRRAGSPRYRPPARMRVDRARSPAGGCFPPFLNLSPFWHGACRRLVFRAMQPASTRRFGTCGRLFSAAPAGNLRRAQGADDRLRAEHRRQRPDADVRKARHSQPEKTAELWCRCPCFCLLPDPPLLASRNCLAERAWPRSIPMS
jgi:hypothetical protein